MTEHSDSGASNVRFEVADNPPAPLVLGMGLQLAILCIAGVILTPAIVVRAAGRRGVVSLVGSIRCCPCKRYYDNCASGAPWKNRCWLCGC